MARDWRWRPASFDGIRFYVDAQELPGGRRLVVHKYAGSERHDVEDMGREPGTIDITAYFVSETSDTDSAALRARLELPGAGLLTIPMFGARRVRAVEWKPGWQKDVLNYVGFTIRFVEDGNAFAPIPVGLAEAHLGILGAGLGGVLAGSIAGAMAGAPAASFLRADMLAQAGAMVASVESLRAATPLPSRIDGETRVALIDAMNAAETPSSEPAAVVQAASDALDAIVAARADNAPADGDLSALDSRMAAALVARSAALGKWGVNPFVTIVPLAAAMAYAAQASRLRALLDYRDRAGAQAARAKIGGYADAITAAFADGAPTLDMAALAAFEEIFGLSAQYLSRRIPDLAPVLLVEIGASLPSNVLAWRLYADPTRGAEMADRNGVTTPLFMPTEFEALAR